VTERAWDMSTEQAPVPEHEPDQPIKVEPAAGVWDRATVLSAMNAAAHVPPQLMPAGVLETVPAPVPDLVTVSVNVVGMNVAVTLRFADMPTVQVPVPEQAPDQPEKVEPLPADAERMTVVSDTNDATQVEPQLMPEGALVTVPVPVPAFVTVRLKNTSKFAVTLRACDIVTVQLPVPVQAPLQPVKTALPAAVAVRIVVVPTMWSSPQSVPQLIPGPLTVPVPVPVLMTVSRRRSVGSLGIPKLGCACAAETVTKMRSHASQQVIEVSRCHT